MSLKKWDIRNRKTEHRNPIFKLISMETTSPKNGIDYTFYRIECGDWVNILPLTKSKEVVLVKQYRAGIEDFSLEIPGGLIDAGENPAQAALRELREETGFSTSSDKLISLGYVYPNPAIQTNKCYLFAAENVSQQFSQELDQMEDIEIVLMPFSEFMKEIAFNNIGHALVLDAVLKYLLKKEYVSMAF